MTGGVAFTPVGGPVVGRGAGTAATMSEPLASLFEFRRYRNKLYLRIPGGEIQYGLLSHRVVVWFRGRCFS